MAQALIAAGQGKSTPVSAGLMAQFTSGINDTVSTLNPRTFLGPGQPMPPVVRDFSPRVYDYDYAQNLKYSPKEGEGVMYWALRDMADNCDLVRTLIETRKDQVSRVPHSWQVRAQQGEPASKVTERTASDSRIKLLDDLFLKPDQEHSFSDWQRMILEDMFVCDDPAVLPRWRNDGKLYGFDVIDGDTISLVIDDDGRTPAAPNAAYRQIIHGLPVCFLSQPDPSRPKTDQLFYFPRNVRSNRLYGFAPVEQIVQLINLYCRRELHQIQFYTDGTVPDCFIEASQDMSRNVEELTRFESNWDAKLTNTANRRKINVIPWQSKVTFAKDQNLKDEMDEYLARRTAFAFGVAPNSLVKMVNRASGEQMALDAKAEGLEPVLFWFKEFMDDLARFCGYPDIEFTYGAYTRENPLVTAQIQQIYLSTEDSQGHSPMLANEVRIAQGLPEIDYDALDDAAAQRQMDMMSAQADAEGGNDDQGEGEGNQASQRRQQQANSASSPSAKAARARQALKKNAMQFRLEKKRLARCGPSIVLRDY